MYYEEQVIDGQLCYRTTPDGPWAVVEYKDLVQRAIRAKRQFAAFDQAREALAYCQAYFDRRLDPAHNHPSVIIAQALAAMEETP